MRKKGKITLNLFFTLGLLLILLFSISIPVISKISIPGSLEAYTNWTDMINSRKSAIAKLPAYDDFPDNATSWADYAERCFEDLLKYDDCWTSEATVEKGFRPYIKGADGYGGSTWTRQSTELMAAMDVLWPMYRYLQLHPNASRQTMVGDFIQELPDYYAEPFKQTINNPYTDHTDYRQDSWYYMENSVLKYGHLYLISNISVLKDPYFGSLQSGLEMAHNFNYLFPQFVSMKTKLITENNNINYCTAGLLAYSLIDAYELTGDTNYLVEAVNALTAVRAVEKPFEVMYEPQELGAGAAAAAKMINYAGLISSTTDYTQLALDLFYAEEQVLYYDTGKIDWTFGFNPGASPWLPASWRDGMHSPYANPKELGNGGINAPAYKENIEAVMFWTDYLKYIYHSSGFKAVEPLKILNLNRIKNFYFFSPNIPDQYERFYGPTTLQYIPYEDIDYHDSRGSYDPDPYKAGYNGKEIYGAGETLWNYLMFEALGEAADNKSLIVNLNVFDRDYPAERDDRVYIVFNPYNEQRTLTYTLKNLIEPYNVHSDGILLVQNIQPEDSFNITLPALGSAYLTLSNSTTTSLPTTETTTTQIASSTTSTSVGYLGLSLVAIVTILYFAVVPRKKL